MHNSHSYALKIINITKSYGLTTIFRNLSLDIKKGEIVILLGANGAGKSTLLRACAGLVRLEEGLIQFHSSSSDQDPGSKASKGYLAHDLHLYSSLTVKENLLFFAKINRVSIEIDSYMESWRLDNLFDKRIYQLSRGQQVRVALARTFIASPKYLFLDEPTSSLDDLSVELLIKKIRDHRSLLSDGCTIVATHDMSRLAGIGSRAIVLHNGRVAYDSDATTDKEHSYNLTVSYYREINR